LALWRTAEKTILVLVRQGINLAIGCAESVLVAGFIIRGGLRETQTPVRNLVGAELRLDGAGVDAEAVQRSSDLLGEIHVLLAAFALKVKLYADM